MRSTRSFCAQALPNCVIHSHCTAPICGCRCRSPTKPIEVTCLCVCCQSKLPNLRRLQMLFGQLAAGQLEQFRWPRNCCIAKSSASVAYAEVLTNIDIPINQTTLCQGILQGQENGLGEAVGLA
eukprot:1896822-Pleurochrysis_carterae.AAC.4